MNQTLHLQKEEILTQNEELQQTQEEILTQRDFIEKQNQSLNGQNIQIKSSIKAALTIQRAILPVDAKFSQFFQEYFILYKPRDIVSGDFYWIERVGKQTIMAVVDCTGHGVPGAFMSLIASNLLEKIIFQKDIIEPAAILTELHKLVRLALNQDNNDSTNGLDMGIVALEQLNENETAITFAGAKRPLYYIDATQSAQVQIVFGTRKSIGGIQNERIDFENQHLTLPAQSILYMSSDGFADQNDVLRKRLGEAKLFQTLVTHSMQSLPNQKEALLLLLNEHMENTEQRDDILFLGVQL